MMFNSYPVKFLIILIMTFSGLASNLPIENTTDKAAEFITEDIPSWVELLTEVESSVISDQESTSGLHYQILDSQIKKETDRVDYFTHISKKVINQNGVENAALLELEYDPLSESIALHHVTVKRGKEVVDHLKTAKIKVLQRERELEKQHYSGKKSINIILDDIRVGDIISYSFTLKSKNINDCKNFYTKVYLSNILPIHFMSKRILCPHDSVPLIIKNHSTDLQANVKQLGKYTEYLWQKKDIHVELSEPNTPVWYDNNPWIEIGEKLNWYEINLSLSEHYKVQALPLSLKKYVDNIVAEKDLEERFIMVMRFIQDEIRYMGMSNRIDGYKPINPELTYQRRFGDCKDKTYLAITMLKALGIEAYPAVVHTRYGNNLESRLPNPGIFNHIIVVAIINGKRYWIDPTSSFQGGMLKDYVQPDYGYALILDGKSRGLTKMPSLELTSPSVEVHEKFDLSKGPEHSGYLTVKTIFRNGYANTQRAYFQTTPRKDTKEDCLKYLQKNYPSIKQNGELFISDDRKKNIITVVEKYEIPDLWERKDNKKRWVVNTYANEFISYLSNKNIFADRKTPITVIFPTYIIKKIDMILPEEWDLASETNRVIDPAFEFTKEEVSQGKRYAISYVYKSLRDHVDTKMVADYMKHNDEAYNLLDDGIFKSYNTASTTEVNNTPKKKDTLNWPIFLLLVIVLIFFIFLAKKIYVSQTTTPINNCENPNLRGIKGWLLLLAFGVLISPFLILKDIYPAAIKVLSCNTWSMISSPQLASFNPLLPPLICLEMLANIGLFVFWAFVAILLFKKNKLFPRMYIHVILAHLICEILDTIMFYFAFSSVPTWSKIEPIIDLGLYVLIWGSYIAKSKRVKATFGQNYTFGFSKPKEISDYAIPLNKAEELTDLTKKEDAA